MTLTKTLISDAGVMELGRLNQLKSFTISSTNITSVSLDNGLRMKNFEWLGTWGWDLQDGDIQRLQQLPNLESLSLLVKTPLTDKSLPHLASLGQIAFLVVDVDNFTDSGLQHLHTMTNLRQLHVYGFSRWREDVRQSNYSKLLPSA